MCWVNLSSKICKCRLLAGEDMNYSPDTFKMFLIFIVQILLNVEDLGFINDTTTRDTVPRRKDPKISKSTYILSILLG